MNDSHKPTIVCLCGSTRFWRTFHDVNLRETLAGRIVLTVAATQSDEETFGHLPMHEYNRVKDALDELHLRKIDLADEVFIINIGGYIGASTSRELEYARRTGKRVRFLEPTPNERAADSGADQAPSGSTGSNGGQDPGDPLPPWRTGPGGLLPLGTPRNAPAGAVRSDRGKDTDG